MQLSCFSTYLPLENSSVAVATGPSMFGIFLSFRKLLSVNLNPALAKEILSYLSTSLLKND
jgi:hypothetical protein